MSSGLRSSVLSELHSLRESLNSLLVEFSAEAGFIAYIGNALEHDSTWALSVSLENLKYPWEIAAYGYRVAIGVSPCAEVTWKALMEEVLLGRNFATADRSTFIYQPYEVLGLALGLMAVSSNDGLRWLSILLEAHEPNGGILGMICCQALWICKDQSGESDYVWGGRDWNAACYFYIFSFLWPEAYKADDSKEAELIVLEGLIGGDLVYRDELSRAIAFVSFHLLLKQSLKEHLADDGKANALINDLQTNNQRLEDRHRQDTDFNKYYWERYAHLYVLSCRILLSVILALCGVYRFLSQASAKEVNFEFFGVNFSQIAAIIVSVLVVFGLNWGRFRDRAFGFFVTKIAQARIKSLERMKQRWQDTR